jgi:hypothetical protein
VAKRGIEPGPNWRHFEQLFTLSPAHDAGNTGGARTMAPFTPPVPTDPSLPTRLPTRLPMRLPDLVRRVLGLARRPEASRRVEVCPPALFGLAAPSWRAGLRGWLDTGWSRPPGAARARTPISPRDTARDTIGEVRAEFLQALADIRTQQVGMLQERVRIARSLRELWHLRPEVFKLVALRFSQGEAECRLERLNRHFPTRAPRSGFGALERGTEPFGVQSRAPAGRR